MRRNLNYIYTLLISYPRTTVVFIALHVGGSFFLPDFYENVGIIVALLTTIGLILQVLAVKIMMGAMYRHWKNNGVTPTPILFVGMIVIIMAIIGLLFLIPALNLMVLE